MSEIIVPDSYNAENAEPQEVVEETPSAREFNLKLTFTEEGVKIDVRSNLSALEQLGATEIFKAHLLASALGPNSQS